MAITLADAQLNAQDDIDFAVIDVFRRNSILLDALTFDDCVNPAGGGATLTYGYTRLVNAAPAGFRAIGSEYAKGQAKRQQYAVNLKPLGGAYEVDRVLASLGPAATNEVAFQMGQLVTATTTKFADEVINGDSAVETNGFDGLDKAITGSSTEIGATTSTDWTALADRADVWAAVGLLDELVSSVKGGATHILGNRKSISRVRMLAGQAGYLTQSEDAFGRPVTRFGDTVLADLGDKADGSGPIVPIETRDPDGAGSGASVTGLTDLYAVRLGLDAVHAVSVNGAIVRQWPPDFTTAGAVKTGEAELGPVAMVLKNTLGAAVLRNVRVVA